MKFKPWLIPEYTHRVYDGEIVEKFIFGDGSMKEINNSVKAVSRYLKETLDDLGEVKTPAAFLKIITRNMLNSNLNIILAEDIEIAKEESEII